MISSEQPTRSIRRNQGDQGNKHKQFLFFLSHHRGHDRESGGHKGIHTRSPQPHIAPLAHTWAWQRDLLPVVPPAYGYHPLCSTMTRMDDARLLSMRAPFSPQCSSCARKGRVANRHGDFGRSRGETRDQSKAETRGLLSSSRPPT
jgi:hypothetical protein